MPYDVIIGRNESDKKLFGKKGLAYIGKSYVTMGNYTSLSNPIYLDIARSHVILICGKRGSGKCLTGDTLITLADGSQIPISEIENNTEKVLSMDNQFKISTKEKTDFFSRETNRLLKIRLRSGKEIKLTPEHPLFTVKGWQEAQSLSLGSRIATPRVLPCFGKEEMPEHEVKLLAYLLAEGHMSNGFVLFSNYDEKIIKEFNESINLFDDNLRVDIHSKAGCFRVSQKIKAYHLKEIKRNEKGQFIDNNLIYEKSSINKWLRDFNLYEKLSRDKFIPNHVLKLNKELVSVFLNRLFSCDGSIYCHKTSTGKTWQISYSSSSETLIRQIQGLLLRFGILSRLRYKKVKCNSKIFDAFELVLGTENVVKFIDEIGFFGIKEEREFDAKQDILSKKRDTNVDTIPKEIWDTFRPENWAEIGRQFHYKYAKAMRESIDYSPSRQKLLKISQIERNNPLYLLATSDIFWDEIVSMEILDGKFTVYDISVPNNHNFVANDIIVHNSYSLGAIAESMSGLKQEESQNIAPLIFDTMGIFWTMKFKNEKDKELLDEWGLKAQNVNTKIFAPFGYFNEYRDKGIPVDEEFAIKLSELEAGDWVSLFELEFTNPVSVAIEKAISNLKEKEIEYDFEDVQKEIKELDNIPADSKNAASALFDAAKTWRVFDKKKGIEIKNLANAGTTTVIDLSMYSSVGNFNIRALIIGLVCKKLFNERMSSRRNEEIQSVQHGMDYLYYKPTRDMPLVWVYIDECLAGESEIVTDTAHTPIQKVVERFENGEKIKVLGFDDAENKFGYYDVLSVYRKGNRKVVNLITETGRKIVCTPEHRVLTSQGFASAFSVDDIACPLFNHYSFNPKLIEARILGHLFGDGWISEKTRSLGFSGKGNRGDLEKIKSDLKTLGFKSSNIFERRTKSTINHKGKTLDVLGLSQSFQSTSGYKFFKEKANFSGKKTFQFLKVPRQILEGSELEKAEFLAALMGSDGNIISKAKNARGDFNAIRFSFNKLDSLEKEALEFAGEIKHLFEDLGIKVSSIRKTEGNLLKDGQKTDKYVITLAKNTENIIAFLERIGYRYCTKKEEQGIYWREYLKARVFLRKEREKIRDKALVLSSKGLGKTKISRELNFPEAQIRDWIYNDMNAGLPKEFPDYDDWVSRRKIGNLLFERVFKIEEAGEESVYDISVDRVHNFVSNNLITHNCHEFLPKEGKTPASDALIQLLREGRQPGISLVMATQQPGKLHTDAMTQSDIVLSHRVTAAPDINALNEIMQSYMFDSIRAKLDALPKLKGSAIILDDNSERIYPCRVRPRFTWHGGEAPAAIKVEREE